MFVLLGFVGFAAFASACGGADLEAEATPDRSLGREPGSAAAQAQESAEDPDSIQTSGEWLPVPEDEVEAPERLLEARDVWSHGVFSGAGGRHAAALLRGELGGGGFEMRRIAIIGERAGSRAEAGFLADGSSGRRIRPGLRVNTGRVLFACGRVTVSRAAPLFSDVMGLTRSGRTLARPRSGAISVDPSLGASAGAMDGAALAWNGRTTGWAFAGASAENHRRFLGAGLGISLRSLRASAAMGVAEDGLRAASLTVLRRRRNRSWSAEGVASSEGQAFVTEATAHGDGALVSARWRYRSWTEKRVAAELSAETEARGPRARLTWRSWAGDAAQDDGVLEVDFSSARSGSWRPPLRVRLGAAGLGREADPAARHEAYAILDATPAQDRDRSLGVHVVRRGTSAFGSNAGSTTVGTRLDVRVGRLGEHSLLVESTQVRSGAQAWGIDLAPSGIATLRARSRPGIWVAARGGFGADRWRLGYTLERAEDVKGSRPWSGTAWLRLR